MKRFKNSFIIISLLLILLVLSSCQNRIMQEPTIKVSHANNELKVTHYLNIKNKKAEDIERGIKDFMIGKRFIDLPVIDFGDKLEINL